MLSKVKKPLDLPHIEDWSRYVGKPLTTWANISPVDCLKSEPDIIAGLRGLSDASARAFLKECHGCLMELLKSLNSCAYRQSRLSSSLSCLSVDFLVSFVESEAALNEYKSFLIDVRRKNRKVVGTVKDSLFFMRGFDGFDCRKSLGRVVDLVSVVVAVPKKQLPVVEVSFSGCEVPEKVLVSSIAAVQSFIVDTSFAISDLLTKSCLEELKENLRHGREFMSNSDFRPWDVASERSVPDLYRSLQECFLAYYDGQVKDWRLRQSVTPSVIGHVAKRNSVSRKPSSSPTTPVDDNETPIPSKIASLLQTKKASRGGSSAASRGQSTSGSSRLPPVSSLVSGKSRLRGRGK